MKKRIVNSLILMGVAFLLLTACSDDDLSSSLSSSNFPVTLLLNVQGEKKIEINTRALDETNINTVWVAVVHEDQTVECRKFDSLTDDKITVADIRITEEDTIHVFANTEVTSVPENLTKEGLLNYFTCTQEQVNNGKVMMYGIFPEKSGDIHSQNITVNLYRVPTKVTVASNVVGHAVSQFKVCRVPKSGYVSYAEGYPEANSTSSKLVVIDPDLSENPAYFIPRKNNSSLGVQENTCLLVQLEGKTGWYRLDFYLGIVPLANGATPRFEDIIRNNWYKFTIQSVKSDGYTTEKEALTNIGSNIVYKMDISSSPGISTNGQYSLVTDKDEIVMGINETTELSISAILTSEIELSTYRVKIVSPAGQLELIDEDISTPGEKNLLPDGGTLKNTDNSDRTIQIKSIGGNLSDSYLECYLGNIVKRIPIILATANCYMVDFSRPGEKVSVSILQANSDGVVRISGNDITPVFIWADHPVAETDFEMIYNASNKSIDITNKTTYSGNIVIGASVGNEIKWSWHLWCFASGQKVIETPYFSYIWMDRALGAYNLEDVNGCGGLLFQHGRKDPFVGLSWAASPIAGENDEPSIYYYDTPFTMTDNHPSFGDACIQTKNENNNIEYAISHPYVFIRGNNIHISGSGHEAESDYDWVTTSLAVRNNNLDLWTKNDKKTIYDPCPFGWRVPQGHTSGPLAGLVLDNQIKEETYCSWPGFGRFYYTALRTELGQLYQKIEGDGKSIVAMRWAEIFADLGAANSTIIGDNFLLYRARDITRGTGAVIRCVKDE